MASTRFTKEMIETHARNIKIYADEILESLKEEDVFESLEGVSRYTQRIAGEIDDVEFRLQDCDEY